MPRYRNRPSHEHTSRAVPRLCAHWGGWEACSDEIIQVMELIWYLVGIDQDPFHHVHNCVKDKLS